MKESVMRSRPPRRAVPGAIAAGVFDLSVHFEGLANPTRLAIVEILARRGAGLRAGRAVHGQPAEDELAPPDPPPRPGGLHPARWSRGPLPPRSRVHRSQPAEFCPDSRGGR